MIFEQFLKVVASYDGATIIGVPEDGCNGRPERSYRLGTGSAVERLPARRQYMSSRYEQAILLSRRVI